MTRGLLKMSCAVSVCCIIALLSSGCTIRVPITTGIGQITVPGRIPLEAGLLMTDEDLAYVYEGTPEGMAYGARPHEFALGSALHESCLEAFSQIFENVDLVRSHEEADKYPVVITPEIVEFKFSYPSMGLSSAARIKVKASLSSGEKVLWTKEAYPPEQRKGMGVEEMGRAVSEALSSAVRQLAREMAADQNLRKTLAGLAGTKAAKTRKTPEQKAESQDRQKAEPTKQVSKQSAWAFKKPDKQGAAVKEPAPEGRPGGKYDVAVLIANRNYSRQGIPEVEYAERDMNAIKDLVVRTMGFDPENIIEEKDATKGTLETLFGTREKAEGKIFNWVKPKESRLFIYYVGHGAPGQESGEAYFVPSDADPDYIENTGYPVSLFYANLKKIPAKEIIVVMDTCFSGQTPKGLLFKRVSPAMLKVSQPESGMNKGVVFASARADQLSTWYESKQHSLFTYFLIKGLSGEADADKDKKITVAEMEAYLEDNVPYTARKVSGRNQTPLIEGDKGLVLVEFK